MSGASPAPVKPRWRRGRFLLLLAAVLGGLIWLKALIASPADVSRTVLLGAAHRASGVLHVHTDLSDGRGTPAEVVDAARRAKADFIVITDHNRVDPDVFDRLGSRPGDPVVIVGSEVSTEAGHILAIGIRPPSFRFSGTFSEVIDDIHHLGGCAFAAHPTSPRGETRFTRAEVPGSFGIEVVNGDTAWREASALSLALTIWTYPVNPSHALSRTLDTFGGERAMWDGALARRFTPVVGGTDAHGRIPVTRTLSIPIPSYEALFNLVRTVVHLKEPLPGNRVTARAAIKKALCAGESVVAIPTLADPKGFSFVAQTPAGAMFGPGSTVRFGPGITLRVGGPMPPGTKLRLIESGQEVKGGEDWLDFSVTTPGVFRAEAYTPGESTPWVLTNPISVLTAESELQRSEAARPPFEPYAQGSAVIDRFDGPTAFAAEHDPGSRVDEPIVDPSGGRGRGGAAIFSFHLNAVPKPPVWCALVDRTLRDLSKNRGVSFWLRADGEYRLWFQIRDLNPASADEGTEAWFASVRTSTAWTLYNIPFASLRSINKTSDGRFDPSKAAHLVFVVDHGAMPFGSQGKIWIDDLMGY